MFLAAMWLPRLDMEGNEILPRKIEMFPFVIMEPDQWRSRNRVAKTMELKPMTSIETEDINEFLIGKVLWRIRERWLQEDFRKKYIYIQ